MRMSWDELHDFLGMVRALLSVVPMSLETHDTGLALAERYGLSTYDAMVVAAALLSGCDTLWSEDMQHGLTIDSALRIVDPFRAG
jgi:predicted nucleic acid-binding protein